MGFAVSHPWSRGSIVSTDYLVVATADSGQHVGSADPTADPLINPHYLEEEHGEKLCAVLVAGYLSVTDMTVLLEMAKFVRALADISPLKVSWLSRRFLALVLRSAYRISLRRRRSLAPTFGMMLP
jgi:ribosomal silencing factor RsfS